MSAIKATKSNDGYPRFDIRITHRVGIMEMVTYLGIHYRYRVQKGGISSLPNKLPRADIIDIVKYQCRYVGLYYVDGWSDELTDKETKETAQWAHRVILRAFPELAKDESE